MFAQMLLQKGTGAHHLGTAGRKCTHYRLAVMGNQMAQQQKHRLFQFHCVCMSVQHFMHRAQITGGGFILQDRDGKSGRYLLACGGFAQHAHGRPPNLKTAIIQQIRTKLCATVIVTGIEEQQISGTDGSVYGLTAELSLSLFNKPYHIVIMKMIGKWLVNTGEAAGLDLQCLIIDRSTDLLFHQASSVSSLFYNENRQIACTISSKYKRHLDPQAPQDRQLAIIHLEVRAAREFPAQWRARKDG